MSSRSVVAAVAAVLALGATTLVTTAASAAPATGETGVGALSCSHDHANRDSAWGRIQGNNVNYRSGPHTNCSSYGQFNNGDKIFYHCYTTTQNDGTWTWGRKDGTNRQGWIKDTLLDDGGSRVRCP
ncbi:hypothetical protein AB0I60_20305 [Actinosynnema sp. NPDC050436]|uniref:hypothetical protein n=1 Tax=Actinosynnema sp. NPDC050436 TaxID=3155659 RepID=UPI0033DC6C05